MKHPEESHPKKTSFLKKPSYPGGRLSFQKFIADNLHYPAEALENKMEGVVYLEYTVDNLGKIENIAVTRGIGYGCSEEAVRLVKLLHYPAVRNKGVKMKVKMKTRIQFKLPENAYPETNKQINIRYTTTSAGELKKTEPGVRPGYSYKITLKQN
jgi:TonB family protein